MSHYLVIDLKARKTNMLQSLGLVSPAPVLPAVLAMHALDRNLQWRLGVRGVGLVHKHCEPWIDYLDNKGFLEPAVVQRRGGYLFDSEAKPQATSMQPMALADIEWTLLLHCEHEISDVEDVRRTLSVMRLAGGVIEHTRVWGFTQWDEALRALRAGRWIEDVTERMQPAHHPVRALLEATKAGQGWVVPANLGYALLETPGARPGARDGRTHAFAEHMMGLVCYTSLFKIKKAGLNPTNLWRYGWDGDQFLVTNRPDVRLSPSRRVAA
jgi:hypothetical protein